MSNTTLEYPYKQFLRNYYLASALYDFIFAYAVYTVLFHMRGLSVFQISILLSIWALLGTLFEVPSGALADAWSRKWMLTIAPLIKLFCFLLWFFADGNFYVYLAGFALWSLGSSFVSGTTEALLYDTLLHFDKTGDYEKVLGKKEFYYNVALAISCISGGFIAHFNIDWAILLSIAPLLMSAFFAFRINEVLKAKSTEEVHYLQYLKIALDEIRTNRRLLYLGVYVWVIGLVFGELEEFDQLYYELVKLPIFAFGIVAFAGSMAVALSAHYAYRLNKYSSALYLLPGLSAVFLILVARLPSIPMIILLTLSYIVTAPVKVLMDARVQRSIKSISRATVTSAIAFIEGAVGFALPVFFGLISKIWNLQAIYLSSAIMLTIFTLWVIFARNQFHVKTGDCDAANPRIS